MKLYDKMQEKNHGTTSLAKEAGVSITAVNFILNGRGGKIYYAGPKVRRKICEVLGIKNPLVIDEFAVAIEHFKKQKAGD